MSYVEVTPMIKTPEGMVRAMPSDLPESVNTISVFEVNEQGSVDWLREFDVDETNTAYEYGIRLASSLGCTLNDVFMTNSNLGLPMVS